MSWIPPNLSSACAVYTTITTCQPQTFLFLQLVTGLFGRSKDAPVHQQQSALNADFREFGFNTEEFSQFLSQNTFESSARFSGEEVPDHHRQPQYDFIVVGAGSAGCVIANRLSEVPHWNILLLEAGDEEPEVADVPAFAPMLQRSSIDWGYMTQPSPNSCRARDNGRCLWTRGKVMGGSSTINYLIYIRGHPKDYDEWAEMGNKGWSYEEVLPYFIKSEDNQNIDKVASRFHGIGGYQAVEIFPYQDQNTIAILEAYRELGLPMLDQNSDRLLGTMLLQHTSKDGKRVSTNRGFIRPIRRKRKNLTIQTRAEVIRVLIDPKTKSAYGVEYQRNGRIVQAIARKEVVLSAGSINSPKVLMLSGVGPADHLSHNGVEVLQDLAVGFNLQDHTTLDGVVFALTNYSATTVTNEQQRSDIYNYKNTQRGPLSSTAMLQSNAFVQTRYEQSHDRPDIQLSIDSTNVQNFYTDPILAAQTNVLPLAYYNGMMMRPILLNPVSRGTVRLNNSDPINGDPLIFANTFSAEIDLLRMVEGIKQSLNLLRTQAFSHLGVSLVSTPLPACRHSQFGSDQYWACVAMSYTTTIFHPVGTCKMGPKSDRSAVVNPKLQVYGIQNLRVIDSSIMPKIVRGNTNAPTIMIAEHGSDFIKARWLRQHGDQEEY